MTELTPGPSIFPWTDRDGLEFRQSAVSLLLQANRLGKLPSPLETHGVFSSGESSVVFLANKDHNPYVVKMSNHPDDIEAESIFLMRCRQAGVAVPQVYKTHLPEDGLPVAFLAMEYVNAPLLEAVTAADRVNNGSSWRMGQVLAHIHSIKGEGFGPATIDQPNQGKLLSFSDLIRPGLDEKLAYLIGENILSTEDRPFVEQAIAILDSDFSQGQAASLTHNDFGPYNILNTTPDLTVIDPHSSGYGHPALDLALTLIKAHTSLSPQASLESDTILEAYKSVSVVSDTHIAAGKIVRAVTTLNTWSHKSKERRIPRLISLIRQAEQAIS